MQAEVPLQACQTWRHFSAPAMTSNVIACVRTMFPPEEHWIFFFGKWLLLPAQLLADTAVNLLSACGCFCSLSDGTGCC